MKIFFCDFGKETFSKPIPQFSLLQIILMFAWPALWFSFLIYIVGPLGVQADGTIPSWFANLIWLLGNGAELIVGLIILRREGYSLSDPSWRERIRWFWPNRWWKWMLALIAVIVGYFLTDALSPLGTAVAQAFPPPDWMPDHPLKTINSVSDAYPDINFLGNYAFVFYRFVILGFVCNMLGEEIYYRGMLYPKMTGVFGRWAWVANGIGFTLKHAYYYWRFAFIWPGGLGLAFIAGPLGSLPLTILIHWVTNGEPFLLIATLAAVLGIQ